MSVSVAQEYLELAEPLQVDGSVDSYLYREYYPIVGTSLNNVNSEIRVVIENQDAFTHPSQSYVSVKGKITKAADGSAFTNADLVTLVNNGVSFLFNNVKYHLGDKLVDDLNYPGYATTMKGILSYGSSDQSGLLSACWKLDDAASTAADTDNVGFAARHNMIIKQTSPKGSFSFLLPASHLLGFFEDYDKIIYGAKQTLTLMRTGNSDALFRTVAAGAAVVELTHVSWLVPHVVPSDEQKLRLYKLIERGDEVKLGFRHWHYDSTQMPTATSHTWRLITTSAIEKPRWVILGFSTNRANDQVKNTAVFDHCNLTDCHVTLNGERYPYLDLNVNYGTGDYATLYQMFMDFRKANYESADVCVDPVHFKAACPLVVIDCTKQSERLQTGVVDVQVKMRFGSAVAANTTCHALVIGDRMMNMKLDKGKIEIVY